MTTEILPPPLSPTFKFESLIPDIEALLSHGISEPSGLSAAFILLLLFIFFCFLSYNIIFSGIRTAFRLTFFNSLLDGVTKDNLLNKRNELCIQAKSKRYGFRWIEFDKTLVVTNNSLQNSFDASHFFNPHTLAPAITESRLLAAVPSFLTAIGVIGTFLGLQQGLSGLNLSDIKHAQSGINQLISGASVAFMTSVWGVGLSVLFNIIEKSVEQWIRAQISDLQSKIDRLFPRVNPEQTLNSIYDENRKTALALDGLAEKIGNQMQKAMTNATSQTLEEMLQGLKYVMEPAIDQLIKSSDALNHRQEKGSEKVLESLLERFSEGFHQQGNEQQTAMESASVKLGDKLEEWSQIMTGFMDHIKTQQQISEQSNQSLVETTHLHINQLKSEMASSVSEVIQQFGTAQETWISARENEQHKLQKETHQIVQHLGDVGKQLGQQVTEQTELFHTESHVLIKHLEEFTKTISDTVTQHIDFSKILLQQSKDLNEQVKEVNSQLNNSTTALNEGASHLNKSSVGLGQVAEKLMNASNFLGEKLSTLTTEVDRLTQEHVTAKMGLVELQENFGVLGERLENTAKQVSNAGESAVIQTEKMLQYQLELQQGMQLHIEQLQEKMADLLNDYSQRVQGQTVERLNEWNNQTRDFSNSMVDATKVIAEIVDEIENKVFAK